MANVRVSVSNVDDGADVFFNGDNILHVDYMKSGAQEVEAQKGDQFKLTIANLTGGPWHATFKIYVDDVLKYNNSPQGSSTPLQGEAWAHTFIV